MKRAIKERHELLVPCALSPTGEHRVWYDCDAARNIVRLASECRREGDAALRLGAETCLRSVLAVRHMVATKSDSVAGGVDSTQPHGAIPDGIRDGARHASYDAARKRKERARPAPDKRPLLVRLLARRARKLSPEFVGKKLRASVSPDGTRNIHAGPLWGHRADAGEGQIVAQKRRGRWYVDDAALANVAKHMGEGEGGRCLVCKDDRAYEDFGAHGRARAHQAGVLAVLRRVVAKLPGGAL